MLTVAVVDADKRNCQELCALVKQASFLLPRYIPLKMCLSI